MTLYVIIKIEQMKKIISTLLFVVGLVSFGIAQESNDLALTNGTEALASSKTSGLYEFTLPSNLTKEKVDASAKYYTSVFTVDFDESSHVAKITMLSNELKDRYVITRLLTACGVKHVQVGESSYELYDFIDKFLK